MTTEQYAMILALLVIVLVIAHYLGRSQSDTHSPINFEDLLLGEDKRMSKSATVMLGAFVVTTWMMVYITLAGKMTEGYLGLFMAAWVTPTVTNLIVNGGIKKAQEQAKSPDPQTLIAQNMNVTPGKKEEQ